MNMLASAVCVVVFGRLRVGGRRVLMCSKVW